MDDERRQRLLADPRVRAHLERIARRNRIIRAIDHYTMMAEEAERGLIRQRMTTKRAA